MNRCISMMQAIADIRAWMAVVVIGLMSSTPVAFAESELTAAVLNNDARLVESLISQGADVNAEDEGSRPLHWAVYNDNEEIVEQLLDAGADVSLPNREGMLPLVIAIINGNAVIAEILLDAGAGVNQTLPHGESPLMMAARTGNTEIAKFLLDRGARVNAIENLRGTTALMWAAAYKNTAMVRLLLASGANIAMKSGLTPPGEGAYIAESARERIRDFYLNTGQGGASLDTAEIAGADGPQVALSREQMIQRLPRELVDAFDKEIEQNRIEPPRPTPPRQWGGLTALQFAVRENDMATVDVLLQAGADINQQSEYGWTPLLVAVQNRYYKLARYLLDHSADPNIANAGGWNALYLATDNRNIEAGSYPTRKPDMDHLEFIKLLLNDGADPNLRMNSSTETRNVFVQNWLREEGATPFLRAAQSGDIEVMKLLLDHGADPNIATRDGVTPLMVAAGIGWVGGVTYEWSEEANKNTIQLLLDLGADPNAREHEDGRTALMGAAFKGRNYAVQMLVDAGADLAARDIGSRDTLHKLAGVTWQAVDYADGLVRIGVQSSIVHEETGALIRKLMRERGMEVPPEGRSLDSICIVDICN